MSGNRPSSAYSASYASLTIEDFPEAAEIVPEPIRFIIGFPDTILERLPVLSLARSSLSVFPSVELSPFPSLSELDLSHNNLTSIPANHILTMLPRLQRLDLSFNHISDISDIVALAPSPTLVSLMVSNNPFRASSLRAPLIRRLFVDELVASRVIHSTMSAPSESGGRHPSSILSIVDSKGTKPLVTVEAAMRKQLEESEVVHSSLASFLTSSEGRQIRTKSLADQARVTEPGSVKIFSTQGVSRLSFYGVEPGRDSPSAVRSVLPSHSQYLDLTAAPTPRTAGGFRVLRILNGDEITLEEVDSAIAAALQDLHEGRALSAVPVKPMPRLWPEAQRSRVAVPWLRDAREGRFHGALEANVSDAAPLGPLGLAAHQLSLLDSAVAVKAGVPRSSVDRMRESLVALCDERETEPFVETPVPSVRTRVALSSPLRRRPRTAPLRRPGEVLGASLTTPELQMRNGERLGEWLQRTAGTASARCPPPSLGDTTELPVSAVTLSEDDISDDSEDVPDHLPEYSQLSAAQLKLLANGEYPHGPSDGAGAAASEPRPCAVLDMAERALPDRPLAKVGIGPDDPLMIESDAISFKSFSRPSRRVTKGLQAVPIESRPHAREPRSSGAEPVPKAKDFARGIGQSEDDILSFPDIIGPDIRTQHKAVTAQLREAHEASKRFRTFEAIHNIQPTRIAGRPMRDVELRELVQRMTGDRVDPLTGRLGRETMSDFVRANQAIDKLDRTYEKIDHDEGPVVQSNAFRQSRARQWSADLAQHRKKLDLIENSDDLGTWATPFRPSPTYVAYSKAKRQKVSVETRSATLSAPRQISAPLAKRLPSALSHLRDKPAFMKRKEILIETVENAEHSALRDAQSMRAEAVAAACAEAVVSRQADLAALEKYT